ncbi:MAG: class I SAM-dependent methyltransferase [Christensenellaceae bacterium]|jgi:SAM-dependent methyltransferase|nr:class I SAM-dependent methyltransferase [Christensenellaceae bacterium]
MPCLLCGEPCRELFYEKFGWRFAVCDRCGFIQKQNRPSREEEIGVYLSHHNSLGAPDYVAYLCDFVQTALLPYLPGSSLLDFGSGPAPVLQALLRRDFGLNADIFDKFFAPQPVYEGKTYDGICCVEVLEHIEDPIAAFSLFHSLLKPGGVLSLMTLFHGQSDRHFLSWFYMRDPTHLSFFTEETLRVLAQKSGFSVAYCDGRRKAALIRL